MSGSHMTPTGDAVVGVVVIALLVPWFLWRVLGLPEVGTVFITATALVAFVFARWAA